MRTKACIVLAAAVFALPAAASVTPCAAQGRRVTVPRSAPTPTRQASSRRASTPPPTGEVVITAPVIPLGARSVALPTPAGFVEATTSAPAIKSFFAKNEAPGLDLLEAHIPASVLDEIEQGSFSRLKFYTKVSIPTAARNVDFSSEDFAQMISTVEEQSNHVLDMNSPHMRATMRKLQDNISESTNGTAKIDISQAISLGRLRKTPNLFSHMLVLSLTEQIAGERKQVRMLCASSIVRLNNRLLFIHAYRTYETENDIVALRDFSETWLKEITAVNRN